MCEQFNSVINKYIARKRINFSLKQLYNTRIQAAIISFNTDGNFLRAVYKSIMKKVQVREPNFVIYISYLYIINYCQNFPTNKVLQKYCLTLKTYLFYFKGVIGKKILLAKKNKN